MNDRIRVLRLDASANLGESSSKKLGDHLVHRLRQGGVELELRNRDLNQSPNLIDGDWIEANFTATDDRSDAQRRRLEFSDTLIAELEWADHIVLTTPMYNFGVPATLKAWVDQVCRAGVTFRYTDNGPEGLLEGKRADIVITTGGVPLENSVDFVSGYLRQVFAFIGISQVNIAGADQMNRDADASFSRAIAQIEKYYPVMAAREVA